MLELFERMNTRLGSLKSYLQKFLHVGRWISAFLLSNQTEAKLCVLMMSCVCVCVCVCVTMKKKVPDE